MYHAQNDSGGSGRRLRTVWTLVAALTAGLAALVLPAPASAEPHGAHLRTVALGLDNPRGLASCRAATSRWRRPATPGPLCLGPGQCGGLSGRVIAIDPSHHRRTVLASGLPSLGGPFAPFGLGGLAVQRGRLYSIVGLNPQAFGDPSTDCQGQPDVSSCVAAVTKVQSAVGFLKRVRSTHTNRGYEGVASVGRFDFAWTVSHPDPGNPDDMPGDADPFGLIAGPRGGFYVVDGASNTLDFVTKRGDVSVLAFVPPTLPTISRSTMLRRRAPRARRTATCIGTESHSLDRWDGMTLTEVLRRQTRTGRRLRCRQLREYLPRQPRVHDRREPRHRIRQRALRRLDRQSDPRPKTSYVARGLNYPTGNDPRPGRTPVRRRERPLPA